MARKKSKSGKKKNGDSALNGDSSGDVIKPPASTPSSSLPVSPSSDSNGKDQSVGDVSAFADIDGDKQENIPDASVDVPLVKAPQDQEELFDVKSPVKPSTGCCSSNDTNSGTDSGGSCCGGAKPDASKSNDTVDVVVLNAEQPKTASSCSSKKVLGENGTSSGSCCSSGKDAAPMAAVAAPEPIATSSCCNSTPAVVVKIEEKPAASTGGAGCCSSKAKETPAKSGGGCCSSKSAEPEEGSCYTPKEPKAEAPVKSGGGCCSSKSTKDSEPQDSCCSSKLSDAPVALKSCGTSNGQMNSCCASKDATPVTFSGCCGSGKAVAAAADSCCSSSSTSGVAPVVTIKNMKLERAPSNSHPDRVRERLFDRVTEFKNERGVSMAPLKGAAAPRKTVPYNNKPVDDGTPVLRLSIGGMTCSGCCTRIEKFMERRPGILDVNVSLLTSRGVFVYDPKQVSAKAIEDMVVSLGFTAGVMPNESYVCIVLHIGYENPERVREVLLSMPGVMAAEETEDVSLSPTSSSPSKLMGNQRAVLVEYDPEMTGARKIVRHLSSVLGFQVYASSPRPLAVQNEEAEVAKFRNYLLSSFILALPIVILEYILPLFVSGANPVESEIVTGLSYKDAIDILCATPIVFLIAYPIHESAFLALRYGSRVTMDVLISLSSFTAYTFSLVTVLMGAFAVNPEGRSETFFEVTALLVTLILVGRYIEKIVKAKASNSVDALLRIQAKTAILLESNTGNPKSIDKSLKESYIDVILVEREDLLKVLPGTRIPTDGVVVEGASTVDESMITGESRKVAKEPGSVVIGGTINSHGVLVMRVTHTITESMLARIVNLVDEAQSSKCVSQNVADVVASYFTTFIISISVIMFFVWYHLAKAGEVATHGWAPFPFALRFAITILVISCPCAISLAVPTAIMVATTIGSQFGVLFKGGFAIEALEKVDVVMFDKTGTLTNGTLAVVDTALPSSGSSSDNGSSISTRQLWSYIAAAEKNSEHAIAKGLVAYACSINAPELTAAKFDSIPGCGVKALVAGNDVNVGSLKWMQDVLKISVPVDLHMANSKFQQHGCVVICVAVNNELASVVALRDTPRPEARFVIEQLKRQKIQTWIVTGDQRETALSIAEMLGIPEFTVIADALPHQKVDKVRLLQSIGKNVAFVGDGVNDGPALAMAHVGIAVGAGTDVALESADLVLVKDDLRDLLNAINLSRATNKMIKWNFSWGFMYNVFMMPLACGALYPFFGISIPPALAGLSELLSSVPVIMFSLLLNFWRPPYKSNDDVDPEQAFVVIQMGTTDANEKTPLLEKKA